MVPRRPLGGQKAGVTHTTYTNSSMDYTFSQRSLKALASCHTDLQVLGQESIKRSAIDFSIVEGHRSIERQHMLYQAGKSKIDGVKKKGKHNYHPSMAFDVCPYINGKHSWRECYLSYLGGAIMAVASRLREEKKISHSVRWGGNWDGDGEIITDQSFIDLPHFELCTL